MDRDPLARRRPPRVLGRAPRRTGDSRLRWWRKQQSPRRDGGTPQRGSTLVLAGLVLPVLMALMALAVDVARIMLVKDELRRAAEAGALAGAKGLLSTGAIDWSGAAQRARDAVTRNTADGTALKDAAIEYGYWNLGTQGWGSSGSFAVGTSQPVGGSWAPGLRVTVARDTTANGQTNGGPVNLFFGPFVGRALQNVTATAVAMQSAPGSVTANSLLPMAINRCMFDQFWNSSTGTPIAVPTTSPYYNAADPYEVRIGSQYQYGTCQSGQWNLFTTTDNSTGAVQNLLANGNPVGMSVGDLTYINSGVKNTLYDSVVVNKTYLVAVVTDLSSGYHPIVAFAPFQVTKSVGGNTKAIFGHFVALSQFPGSLQPGGSVYYGTPAPPALVR